MQPPFQDSLLLFPISHTPQEKVGVNPQKQVVTDIFLARHAILSDETLGTSVWEAIDNGDLQI